MEGVRRVTRAGPKRGWRHRLFAALLPLVSHQYEPLVAERKRRLFGCLHGRVVEIGAGTGVNLRYLPGDAEWLGVDPNPYMERYIRAEAARLGRDGAFCLGAAEQLPVPARAADAVVGTLVLCSVTDLESALREIVRVLRPGGRFVFIEHVGAPPGTRTRRRQDCICPLWRRLADGCHPNRDTVRWIERAGFSELHCESFTLPLPIAGPHIAGFAVK